MRIVNTALFSIPYFADLSKPPPSLWTLTCHLVKNLEPGTCKQAIFVDQQPHKCQLYTSMGSSSLE